MTGTQWLRTERAGLAEEQILTAAGRLFAEAGVAAVTMADVATAAGCSRATLYRYFENRDALRSAFVHRETRRIAAVVAGGLGDVVDPRERLVRAMVTSLRLVREDATLAAWFHDRAAGIAVPLAQSSDVIEELASTFLGPSSDPAVRRRARWVVRVLLSFLADPAGDADLERSLIEEFVVPVVAARSDLTVGSG